MPCAAQSLARARLPQDGQFFDLILRTTDDPNLLTARQATLRQKLLDNGVDPVRDPRRISIATRFRQRLADRAQWAMHDPPRQVEILEVDWAHQLVKVFRFPETHLFYTSSDTNLVGVAFEAPRDVTDSTVTILLADVDGWMRSWVSIGLEDRWWQTLQSRQRAAQEGNPELLNFTIPVKLPRTLERLIGDGEQTKIKITGQETISISGQSTVSDEAFVGNEINQRPSLFPSLEMQQTLRVNLDGQVGEKIKVRVTHDSEAIGPQATQVKLSFEGDEDDIVQAIRAGNIDITLPGSRLLGVRASQGGLFGIKVEGAVGPVKYTVLTSKEQSQTNRSTFNQSGGTEEEFVISSTDYIKNRFFRLTAPVPFFFADGDSVLADLSGLWPQGWRIDQNTVELFVSDTRAGNSDENTFENGHAFVDRDGFGFFPPSAGPQPTAIPDLSGVPFEAFSRWRRLEPQVEWSPLQSRGEIIGVVLERPLTDNGTEALGATYDIVDETGAVVRRVGRPFEQIPDPQGGADPIFFFKLLKPASPDDPFVAGVEGDKDITWEYMYRNFYDLKGSEIAAASFQLRIERNDPSLQIPELDTSRDERFPWFRVFGLDREDSAREPIPDDQPDVDNDVVFNFFEGYLQFPTVTPFDPPQAALDEFTGVPGYPLSPDLRAPDLYRRQLRQQVQIAENHFFNIVVRHASTSSRFRLNAFNIKDGSEEVTLDGRLLQRGVDYDIDYFSGEIQLTGAASELNSQSNIGVTYEIDPLFGGGRTSLNGIYLGYDISPRKSLSTTWLLQSKPNASQKPRLGEEPSRAWVGNVATKLQFAPPIVRKVANLLPLVKSSEEVSVNFDAEAAISIPDPNTRRSAYLEDFEAVDESDNITMTREGWFWTSLPVSEDPLGVERRFRPEDRAYSRWHRPVPGVKRGDLNPDLSEQEERDIVPALQLRFESNHPDRWQPEEFAGLMRGFGGEVDLSRAQFLEFWVNDLTGDGTDGNNPREGVVHFDFGFINEDFYWPRDDTGGFVLNTYETEDRDNNLILNFVEGRSEDTGLDGLLDFEETEATFPQRPGRPGDPAGDNFDPSEVDPNEPFPYIIGTEANQRLDSEDLNRNTVFDQRDGYFTLSLDLADTNTFADIYEDYADDPGFIAAARERGDSWRKYRLDLRHLTVRRSVPGDGYLQATPDLERVRYFRIWFENPQEGALRARKRTVLFAEMRFLGSRWLADGIRTLDDQIVERTETDTEDFRLGVVNNKETEAYIPPITPDIQNNVEEKEQALQLLYTDLESGHQVRVRKDVPGTQGQDFTVYGQLNYYWRGPIRGSSLDRLDLDPDQYHLEAFTWMGSDSLNYYEIAFAFDEVATSEDPGWDGWVPVRVDLGALTNLKTTGQEEPLFPGSPEVVTRGVIIDPLTQQPYRVTIRGRPDIRRVKRYYAGVRHPLLTTSGGQILRPPVTGNVLFNELRLKEVDRDIGLAKRAAMNTNIPGLGDVGLEWSETDPSFRGLDQRVGRQLLSRDWNARFGSNLSNWIPTLGLDVPFSLATNRSLQLPRFLTNSDVELLTDQERDDERTEEWRERFNFQVRKRQPSTNRILQYTVDRLGFSLSGSRAKNISPRERIRRKSADTRYNYDLRFARGFEVRLPFTRSRLRLLPAQVSLGSAWRYDETRRTAVFPDGTLKIEQPRFVKTVNNDVTITYNPLASVRTTFAIASQRDILLGEDRFLGIDFGQEKVHNERLSVNLTPDNKYLKWFEPDVTYSSAYGENRRPALQQYGPDDPRDEFGNEIDGKNDGLRGVPGEVRHINNNNDISIRAQFKLTQWIKRKWGTSAPAAPQTQGGQDDRLDQARIDRSRRRDLPPPAAAPVIEPDSTQVQPPAAQEEGEELPPEGEDAPTPPPGAGQPEEEEPPFGDATGAEETPDETLERIRREAQRQQEEEARRQAEEEAQRPAEPPAEGEAPASAPEEDRPFNPASVLKAMIRPLWNSILNLQPVTGNYQVTNQSGFQHVSDRGSILYRMGLVRDPGVDEGVLQGDEQLYSTSSRRKTERVSLSTQTQVSTNLRLDLSFTGSRGKQEGSTTGERRDYSVEWPNATLRVSNVHKWKIFGEMLTASSMDLTVRKTRTASGVTDQVENPRVTMAYGPRWNLSFHNGLDASLSLRLNKDTTRAANSELRSNRNSIGLTLSKKFDAEGRLGFLRFGRKGTGSTIDMRVDSSYDRTFQERFDLVTSQTNQQTGRTNLSVRPSFSYLFSRNLRAGLELSYSRGNDLSRQTVSQSVGLGFNATLTF